MVIAKRLPISTIKFTVLSCMGPMVSNDNGLNSWDELRLAYLASFLSAAVSAALPAEAEVARRCDGARVSATVTSHTKHLPLRHVSA